MLKLITPFAAILLAATPIAVTAVGPAQTRFPIAVKVLTESDAGIGSMSVADMAKLVTFTNASGAPAGFYTRARAAGMKTVWYVDPHRIGDVPGGMSDRPPVNTLVKDADLMKCAGGGILDSTYSPKNGTVFGDPTSKQLSDRTNEQLAQAVAHYGPVDYLWKDDAVLLTDMWADAWFCGNSPPALSENHGNGMPAIGHGNPTAAHIAYADRRPYTSLRYLADLAGFDGRLHAPVLDEGACTGDGTSLGGTSDDGGATATLVASAANSAGALCEDFAEGWGNAQTLDGKAVDRFWKQDVNSGIQVVSAKKFFIVYPYIGNQGASNRGRPVDFDQRGYIYASYMLLFDREYAVYKPGAWGATLKTVAPVMVLPENLLVPLEPIATAHWPQRIDQLAKNGIYVREFRSCAYAGEPIGPCAALVNPSSTATLALPELTQTYHHRITFNGNNGAFTGRHGTPDYGDTGDIAFAANPVPQALPPAGWAILVR